MFYLYSIKLIFYKKLLCKQIIFNRPKERFVIFYHIFQIWYLNKNINFIQYICHLKFIISYAIENKNTKNIVNKLKLCFKEFGVPKQLGSDNGFEFNNKEVEKSLKNSCYWW